jgi:hypothetical protein
LSFELSYIEPLFGFDPKMSHIAVCDSDDARTVLSEMGRTLPETNRLIAIYIPLGVAPGYGYNSQAGRVVGAVRLLPMPTGRSIYDYYHHDELDPERRKRWPTGWPCETVYAPPADQCLYLRTVIDTVYGAGRFQPYASRFQYGPFRLEPQVAAMLLRHFEGIGPIRPRS